MRRYYWWIGERNAVGGLEGGYDTGYALGRSAKEVGADVAASERASWQAAGEDPDGLFVCVRPADDDDDGGIYDTAEVAV
jgi:hypothetical protein